MERARRAAAPRVNGIPCVSSLPPFEGFRSRHAGRHAMCGAVESLCCARRCNLLATCIRSISLPACMEVERTLVQAPKTMRYGNSPAFCSTARTFACSPSGSGSSGARNYQTGASSTSVINVPAPFSQGRPCNAPSTRAAWTLRAIVQSNGGPEPQPPGRNPA